PAGAGAGAGLREAGVDGGDAGVRDEALRAVEDVLVALAVRLRAHRRRVGARAGLGQRVRGQPLAGGEPRQEALLLLVRAGELDAERAELLHGDDQPARRAHLRDLLDRNERHQRARAKAAVLLVEENPEDLVLPVERDDVPGKLGRLVDLRRPRRDALARELPDQLADLALLVGQRIKRHEGSVFPCLELESGGRGRRRGRAGGRPPTAACAPSVGRARRPHSVFVLHTTGGIPRCERRNYHHMGIALSLILIAAGAILVWAGRRDRLGCEPRRRRLDSARRRRAWRRALDDLLVELGRLPLLATRGSGPRPTLVAIRVGRSRRAPREAAFNPR